jgi:hypothetical protein
MGNCKSYPDPNPVGTNTISTTILKGEYFCAIDNFLPLLIGAIEATFQVVFASTGIGALYLTAILASGKAESALFPGEKTVVNSVNKSNFLGLNNKRIDYCRGIADEDEWEYDGNGDSCKYNSCHSTKEFPSHLCCKGCCPIPGQGVECKRAKFVGNPFVCCINDYAGSTDDTDAFQTPDKMRTCDPNYRDLGKKPCRDLVFNFCSGTLVLQGQDSFKDAWAGSVGINIPFQRGDQYPVTTPRPCVKALYRALYGEKGTEVDVMSPQTNALTYQDYDEEGLIWGKKLMKNVLNKYIQEYSGLFKRIDEDGIVDTDMYNIIQNICSKDPALCSDSLKNVCSSFDEKTLLLNPSAIRWCGCYMPDDQYSKYTDFYGIAKECTPFCSLDGAIPSVNDDGNVKYCQQNVCIIDDVSVKLANTVFTSDSSKNLNFNQLCSSCGKSNVVKTINAQDSTLTQQITGTITKRTGILDIGKNTTATTSINTVTDSYKGIQTDININRCECHISTNLNVENSVLNGVNYLQNCGNMKCYNIDGSSDCISGKNEGPSLTSGTVVVDHTWRNTFIIFSIIFFVFILIMFMK